VKLGGVYNNVVLLSFAVYANTIELFAADIKRLDEADPVDEGISPVLPFDEYQCDSIAYRLA
jgi:hypothetical protein